MDKIKLMSLYSTNESNDYNKIRQCNSLIDKWVKHLRRKDNVEKSTIKNFISQLGTTIERIAVINNVQHIDDEFISNITLEDLKLYWDNCMVGDEKRVSASKRKVKLAVWNSFFVNFLDKNWKLENVFVVAKVTKKPISMNPDELIRFMGVIDDKTDYLFFSLLVGSGMREEEAKFQFRNNIIDQKMKVNIMITDLFIPKERKERDTIMANKTLVAILDYPEPPAAEERWEPLLLLNSKGKPVSLTTMRNHFLKYCKLAGIRRNLSMHKLRSTFTSLMIRSGYTIEQVHRMLGHASMDTTRKWYLDMDNDWNIDKVKSPLDTYL